MLSVIIIAKWESEKWNEITFDRFAFFLISLIGFVGGQVLLLFIPALRLIILVRRLRLLRRLGFSAGIGLNTFNITPEVIMPFTHHGFKAIVFIIGISVLVTCRAKRFISFTRVILFRGTAFGRNIVPYQVGKL